MKNLILGSTSPYRKELLEKLQIPFQCQAPLIDEEKEKDPTKAPIEFASHLAFLKAKSLAKENHVIIGADQVVSFAGQILGKSHTPEKAFQQLREMQGKVHELISAVCIFNEHTAIAFVDVTKMTMRNLTDKEIRNYVSLDKPMDCAGSYKIEKHGVALFEKIECADFTAIQGLPLLQLNRELRKIGF